MYGIKESFKNNWYFLLWSRWHFWLCRFVTKLRLCSSPATPKFLPDTLSIKIPLISLQLLIPSQSILSHVRLRLAADVVRVVVVLRLGRRDTDGTGGTQCGHQAGDGKNALHGILLRQQSPGAALGRPQR